MQLREDAVAPAVALQNMLAATPVAAALLRKVPERKSVIALARPSGTAHAVAKVKHAFRVITIKSCC